MSASTTAMNASSSVYSTGAFWERLWRMSGINFVVFASASAFVAFYGGGHLRVLTAAFLASMAILNFMWFVAALRTTLADAGRDGGLLWVVVVSRVLLFKAPATRTGW